MDGHHIETDASDDSGCRVRYTPHPPFDAVGDREKRYYRQFGVELSRKNGRKTVGAVPMQLTGKAFIIATSPNNLTISYDDLSRVLPCLIRLLCSAPSLRLQI